MSVEALHSKGSTHPVSSHHRSKMDTVICSLEDIAAWRLPPCQRIFRENAKVRAIAKEIKASGGVVPGVITLGTVPPHDVFYIVDGNHRIEAFRLSCVPEMWADVRIVQFDSMAELAKEFTRLNGYIARMSNDDLLRAAEEYVPALGKIRTACPFVGYHAVRKNRSSPMITMSQVLRCWAISSSDSCMTNPVGSVVEVAESLTDESVESLIRFLTCVYEAWGDSKEYLRLWSGLNLTLCMWCWRRMVEREKFATTSRYDFVNIRDFTKCLMALSTGTYIDWLLNRRLSDRDRGPAYDRIRKLWFRALAPQKVRFPYPDWFDGGALSKINI